MADGLRPLTLLLAGAALWALCLLILALGGLGSNFATPRVDAGPPPVPQVSLSRTESRLGPYDTYAVVGTRPLMNDKRKPVAFSAVEAEPGAGELDVTLTSVLITPRLKLAILSDNKEGGSRRVRLGDAVEGSNWRLVALEPRKAVLEGPSGQRTLELRVFDGQSGELPTPLASVAAGEAPPPRATATPAGAAPANPPAPTKPAVAQNVPPATVNRPDPATMTQEQQVEAIRRRIEARRAQMRAEAATEAANQQQ